MDWLDHRCGMPFDKRKEWQGSPNVMVARVNKNNTARSPAPEWVTMRGFPDV
jgi:hypothetical protein